MRISIRTDQIHAPVDRALQRQRQRGTATWLRLRVVRARRDRDHAAPSECTPSLLDLLILLLRTRHSWERVANPASKKWERHILTGIWRIRVDIRNRWSFQRL